jgi:hypothetical protein
MNEIDVKWKIIKKGLPSGRHFSEDRVPTLEEIKKLLEFSDRRIKPIVLLMVSSGIIVGAFDYLKWKHIIPILDEQQNQVIAAKIIVYAGNREEYFSFITLEAYREVKNWMEFRAGFWSGDYYDIVGEIANNAYSGIEYVKIISSLYDKDNKIIGTEFTYTDPTTITPNSSAPFKLMIGPSDVSNFELVKSIKLVVSGR